MSKRRSVLALVMVLGVPGAIGCGKKNDDPKPAEGQAAPAAPGTPSEKPAARPPGMRRAIAPITLEEVQEFLPPLDGARVIKANAKAEVGERIEAAYCFDKGEISELGDQIRARLTASGWPEIRVRTNPQVADRMGLSAHKPPYMMTGTIQRGMLPDCLSSKGQTYVAIGVHKIELREGEGAYRGMPGGPPPGAAGLGRPRPMGPRGPMGTKPPLPPRNDSGAGLPAPTPTPAATP